MNVNPVKTRRVEPGALTLPQLLDEAIDSLEENTIIAITSKIVSLCEGSVLPSSIDRDELIAREADFYLPKKHSIYGHRFTVKNNTLIASAGIDQSNGDGRYILWPKDSWKSAKEARDHLAKTFNLNNIGVLITDSTCQPLRRGTTGIALGYAGFRGIKKYINTPDLFGRPFQVTNANVAGGLAAAAVVTMGEGAESTPIAIISDIPNIIFDAKIPDENEINKTRISPKDDLFAPFLESVEWIKGGGDGTK